jgi:hypothetical protein
MLAMSVAGQHFQTVPGRDSQIVKRSSRVEQIQLPACDPP